MVVFFDFVNGALIPKFGYYMPWYMFGDAMILVGSSLMGCKYLRDARCNLQQSPSTGQARSLASMDTLCSLSVGTACYLLVGIAVVEAKVPASEVNNAVGFMTLGAYSTYPKRLALLTWRPDSTNTGSNRNSQRGRFFVPEHWH